MFGRKSANFYGLGKRKEPEKCKSKKLRRAGSGEAHACTAAASVCVLVIYRKGTDFAATDNWF